MHKYYGTCRVLPAGSGLNIETTYWTFQVFYQKISAPRTFVAEAFIYLGQGGWVLVDVSFLKRASFFKRAKRTLYAIQTQIFCPTGQTPILPDNNDLSEQLISACSRWGVSDIPTPLQQYIDSLPRLVQLTQSINPGTDEEKIRALLKPLLED